MKKKYCAEDMLIDERINSLKKKEICVKEKKILIKKKEDIIKRINEIDNEIVFRERQSMAQTCLQFININKKDRYKIRKDGRKCHCSIEKRFNVLKPCYCI